MSRLICGTTRQHGDTWQNDDTAEDDELPSPAQRPSVFNNSATLVATERVRVSGPSVRSTRSSLFGGTTRRSLALLFVCLGAAACSASRPSRPVDDVSTIHPAGPDVSTLMSDTDRHLLATLSAERASQAAEQGTTDGYRIGPDDLLDIRIPDLLGTGSPSPVVPSGLPGTAASVAAAPVFHQGLRVSASGDVNLPVLGAVLAMGMTPLQLEGEIARRLVAAGILRAPQVSVLVAEYRSRVVAVIGSVERPGLYPVTRPGATVADLIWAAGGPSKDAGRLVQFSPASSSVGAASTVDPQLRQPDRGIGKRIPVPDGSPAANCSTTDETGTVSPLVGEAAGDPIRIDLALLLPAAGRTDSLLNPQVRQGDVISLAPAGSAQVDGWVERPGSYPLTRNYTLSGAIAAAGGTNFAADLSRVAVKRALAPGQQRSFTIDLAAVNEGRVVDVPIIDGDVVYAPVSPVRVVPWGIWTFITTVFRFGASVVAL